MSLGDEPTVEDRLCLEERNRRDLHGSEFADDDDDQRPSSSSPESPFERRHSLRSFQQRHLDDQETPLALRSRRLLDQIPFLERLDQRPAAGHSSARRFSQSSVARHEDLAGRRLREPSRPAVPTGRSGRTERQARRATTADGLGQRIRRGTVGRTGITGHFHRHHGEQLLAQSEAAAQDSADP